MLAVVVTLPVGQIAYAEQQYQLAKQQHQLAQQKTEYFKLVSTVEYMAKRGSEEKRYRHQLEPWFIVTSAPQNPDQTHYNLITTDFQLRDPSSYELYRGIDEINYGLIGKRYISNVDDDLLHLRTMNNECVKVLADESPKEVGDTWTCRFNLGLFNHYSLPDELRFTVTSITVPTDELGDLVAVRAISDPFMVKALRQIEGYGYVKCKIAAVYLFDPYVYETDAEDIYVSAMVFLASTNMDSMDQQYRYEFGTYKTEPNTAPVDMEGLGFELEDFVREIELIPEPMEVDPNETAGLPSWAQSEVANAAQIASACAAVACEQNVVNPVASIYLAAARTYQLQKDMCVLIPEPCPRSVCQALRYDVEEIYPMEICGGRPLPLWPLGFIPLAFVSHGGGGGGGGDDKSPYKPTCAPPASPTPTPTPSGG
ncbi:MAG: hypothetical protein JW806_09660 [Sedimentisphaerales bacterium]|nr:hypothetical protein [Sedimentisphaerales bacterium]